MNTDQAGALSVLLVALALVLVIVGVGAQLARRADLRVYRPGTP